MGRPAGTSAGPLPLTFVTSADDLARLPPTGAEVAVVGRSNVGKSSLLNALANHTGLAHVSKTPGRTRLLNCFSLDGTESTLVDCPGYGYAKVSRQVRSAWPRMIEGYLLGRDELVTIVVLVDGEVGPTKLDLTMVEWLAHHERPFTVVATKHDKVKSSARDRRRRDLAEGVGLSPADVLWVSATKNVNIDLMRARVRSWLSA